MSRAGTGCGPPNISADRGAGRRPGPRARLVRARPGGRGSRRSPWAGISAVTWPSWTPGGRSTRSTCTRSSRRRRSSRWRCSASRAPTRPSRGSRETCSRTCSPARGGQTWRRRRCSAASATRSTGPAGWPGSTRSPRTRARPPAGRWREQIQRPESRLYAAFSQACEQIWGSAAVAPWRSGFLALLPADRDQPGRDVKEAATLLAQIENASAAIAPGLRMRLALGTPADGAANLSRSLEEAERALMVSRRLKLSDRPVFFEHLGVYRVLLGPNDASHHRGFAEEMLGGLQRHDAQAGIRAGRHPALLGSRRSQRRSGRPPGSTCTPIRSSTGSGASASWSAATRPGAISACRPSWR